MRTSHSAPRPHRFPRVALATAHARSTAGPGSADADQRPVIDERVYAVQRIGAVVVGLILLVFGLLGLTSGVPFLSTQGRPLMGLSSNGLLSVLSVVVAGVLIGAALRSPRVASTVMIVLGVLFLTSALVNMSLLRTGLNLLAFRMSNVIFSIGVGLVLLLLGAYGRISGHLPADSPYAHPHERVLDAPEVPATPDEVAAEAAMRQAEIAVVEHRATEDQRRRVDAMAAVHTRAERREVWMTFGRPTDEQRAGSAGIDRTGGPQPRHRDRPAA